MALNKYNYTHPLGSFSDLFRVHTTFLHPSRRESVSSFRQLFEDLSDLDHIFASDMMSLSDALSSPAVTIHNDEDSFRATMAMPTNVQNASQVVVELLDDNRVLHVYGGESKLRKNKGNISEIESSVEDASTFDYHLTLDRNVERTKIEARLVDGILSVTAPKKQTQESAAVRIPVIDGPPQKETKEVGKRPIRKSCV